MERRTNRITCRWIILATAGAFVVTAGAAGDIRYVDDDAAPGGDGLSWSTPYRHLQDALIEAAGDPMIDEIRIAGGVHQPDRDEGGAVAPGDREATFALRSGLAVRGGFRGLAGGGDPDERDLGLFRTVLSGDLLGDDGEHFLNYDENSYHVVSSYFDDDTTVLDGVTITAGNADRLETLEAAGAGIFNWASDARYLSCIVRDNRSLRGGSGMYIRDVGRPTLVNCLFVRNAHAGNNSEAGGIYIHPTSFAATMINCSFCENSTLQHVAAIFVHPNTVETTVLRNCIVWGNPGDEQIGGGGPLSISYSDIEAGWPGIGNVDADPQFVDPLHGDFRLFWGSRCIDAGDNTALDLDVVTDVHGNRRFVDDPLTLDTGVVDHRPPVDMGCCEYQARGTPAPPASFEVIFGRYEHGTVDDLLDSDDAYLEIEQRPAVTPRLPLIRLQIQGRALVADVAVLRARAETAATSAPTLPPQTLSLFDYDAGAWEVVDERMATARDAGARR